MDISKYIKTSLNLWKLDKSEAKKVQNQNYSILLGCLIVAITTTFIVFFTLLPELVTPTGDLVFGDRDWALPLLLLSPLIGVVSIVFALLSISWSYLWIKIFGGKANFLKTVEVFLLIQVPLLFVNVFISMIDSIILIFAGLYSEFIALFTLLTGFIILPFTVFYFIVVVNTISTTHSMETLNTVLAGITSIFVLIALFVVLILIPAVILLPSLFI